MACWPISAFGTIATTDPSRASNIFLKVIIEVAAKAIFDQAMSRDSHGVASASRRRQCGFVIQFEGEQSPQRAPSLDPVLLGHMDVDFLCCADQ